MQKVRPVDTYMRLLKIAARRPKQALREWLSEVEPERTTSPTVMGTHQRGLRRLIAQSRGAVRSEHVEELEGLITRAERRLALAVAAIGSNPAIDPDPILTLSPTGGAMVMPATKRSDLACPPDLARLQEIAARWPQEQWVRWLAEGFKMLQDGGGPPHLAFPPIRLYPLGRYFEQLKAAIEEAGNCRLAVASALHWSVGSYLGTGAPALPDGPRFDPLFWQLYARGPQPDNLGLVASAYLGRYQQSSRHPVDEVELVDSICDAVFETVSGATTVALVLEAVATRFDNAAADAALVIALMNEAQDDIGFATDPVPEAAQACRAIIARRPEETGRFLGRLLNQGRLVRRGELAFGVAIDSTSKFLESLSRAAARRVPHPKETLSQPSPIPLSQTRILELAA